MADTKRKLEGQKGHTNYHGSTSGEKFARGKSRRDSLSARRSSIDLLAMDLGEYVSKQDNSYGKKQSDLSNIVHSQKRFNESFHNYRILVVMMSGMLVGLMLLLRFNVSIAILKMVNQTHMYLDEHPDRTVDDFLDEGHSIGGEFNWNNEIVQMIMSWYMITCTLPQIPAAKLATMIGCRLSAPIFLSLCAISSILTPYSAYLGWQYMIALRMINGVGASAVLPIMFDLTEVWMRYNEISYGLSISHMVTASMCALTPLVAGYLSGIHWSLAFYVPGAITLVFCALWLILVADSPDKSRFISDEELRHIYSVDEDEEKPTPAAASVINSDQIKRKAEHDRKVGLSRKEEELEYKAESWTQIFKVPSFYACLIIWVIYDSTLSCFTFVLPSYLEQSMKINVAQNGLYCFIIQAGTIFSAIWPHPLLRMLQKRGLSITKSRIVSHAICCSIVAATWCYVGIFHEYAIFLLFVNRAFHLGNNIILNGSLMSNYAKAGLSSIAFAFLNTLGNLAIVPTSTLIGWVLDYTNQSLDGWCWIFCGMGVSQIVMFAIFAFFVDSKPIKFKKSAQQKDVESSIPKKKSRM